MIPRWGIFGSELLDLADRDDMSNETATRNRPERIELMIEGMHCASCVARIESALAEVDGVEEPSVNLATGRASVAGSDLDTESLTAGVDRAGYSARAVDEDGRPARVRLAVEGMHCASCVAKVEDSLRATAGVVEASVNLANGEAAVTYERDQLRV